MWFKNFIQNLIKKLVLHLEYIILSMHFLLTMMLLQSHVYYKDHVHGQRKPYYVRKSAAWWKKT